ncbi:MAG: MATE family efflux transporter, partial [Planctomycetes bacterium]|nr:MATE family efflux transporter [Planctomycetota bacterium]
ALSGALILIAFKTPLLTLSLCLIYTTPSVKGHVADYFAIRILAAPATISLFAITGWFFGMQNARYPMFLAISVNLLNIGFSFWFVQISGMTSKGVALGTLLAQYCGLILASCLFYKKYRYLLPFWNRLRLFEIDKITKFLTVNSDIIIRTLCLMFAFSFFKVQSAREGIVTGSANIVLLELFMVIAFGIDGFANAAESIVGKYFGARDRESFRDAIKRSFQWAVGLSILMVLVFYLFGSEFLEIITDNQEVINAAHPFLVWIIVSPVINTIPFIWDGIYIGITASKAMRNTMLMSTFLFFLPTYYLFHSMLGNHALWLALTLLMLARGISQTMLAKHAVFNRLK